MKLNFQFLLISVLLIFTSCKTNKISTSNRTNESEIDKKNNIYYNFDKSLILIKEKKNTIEAINRIDFKIIEQKTKDTIYSDVFYGVDLNWFDNNSLKGMLFQGIIKKEINNPDKIYQSHQNRNFIIIKIKP